jgi:hypothetical protein
VSWVDSKGDKRTDEATASWLIYSLYGSERVTNAA